MSLTANGSASAVQQGDHQDLICIYWCATLPTGQLTPMAGGVVVTLPGRSINVNRCGWRSHPLSMPMCIHPDLRLRFRQFQPQASSSMTAPPTSVKSPTSAGRISLTAARRAASCVQPDLVPPRRPAPRSGFFRKVQPAEFTPFMFASLRCARQRKARSIPFGTQVKTIKWSSIRRSFRIPFT